MFKRLILGIALGTAVMIGATSVLAKDSDAPYSGLRAMEHKQCIACHTIPGTNPGYRPAPILQNLNQKVSPDWLVSFLADPDRLETSVNMPHYKLQAHETQAIATYLLGAPPTETKVELGDPVQGKKLFKSLACIACHYGGEFASDLTNAGNKLRPDFLERYLINPQAYHGGIVMPSFRLSETELRDLTAYLATRKALAPTVSYQPQDADRGKQLFQANSCASCHVMPGFKAPEKRSLELAGLTASLNAVIRGKADLNAAVHPRLSRQFVYAWDDGEQVAIANALLKVGSETQKPMSNQERAFRLGRQIVSKYNCRGCHVIEGKGESIGPVLDIERLRVKKEWLVHFLANPGKLRPNHPTRMPRFPLRPDEIEGLVAYFDAISQRDYANRIAPPLPIKLTAAEVQRGRKLFAEKNCGWCHTANQQPMPVSIQLPPNADLGAPGRFAPDLGLSKQRLEPGWTERWIRHPSGYLPESLMPDFSLSAKDAAAIRAYLWSQPGD